VVIDTVVAKYSDHLPLYRQSVILQREAGVEIGRATLDGWVMRVGEFTRVQISCLTTFPALKTLGIARL
jgi:hypothetical protein